MGGDGVDLEAIAEGLWLRLRDVILAERRLERFAFRPDAHEASVPGRLASLVGDASALDRLAQDVTLRALAAGADAVSWRILGGLGGEGELMAAMARRLDLPELALAERVGALAQAGLAARDLERNAVLPTPAGQGLVAFVDALARALGDRLSRELPGLLGC